MSIEYDWWGYRRCSIKALINAPKRFPNELICLIKYILKAFEDCFCSITFHETAIDTRF